jgi:type IV pilus assembly protein PilQ
MVLVDLQKVSSSALKQRQRSLDSPTVKSYRVLEYKSVGGIGVTRVELTVTDAAKLQVKETKNGLQLLFTSDGSATASHATPAAAVRSVATSAPAPKPAASVTTKPVQVTEAASLQPVTIRNIGVVRTSAGTAVEIEGAKTAKTLRLSGPERLVVDVENSLSATKQRTIMVNAADLKSVRISQFQLTPPVTRVVLDLTGPRDFNLANRGNKLVVTVLPPRAAQSANLTLTAPSPKVEARATSASAASPQVKPIAATARLSAALAFAPLTQTASMNSSTAVLHPVGSAFIDQTAVNAASQKEPPAQKDVAPVPAQVRMDAVSPVQKAAPAPVHAPQAIQAKQSGTSGEAPAKPAPEALSADAQKNPDYVFVVPDYKKQTVAPAQQTVAPAQQTVAPVQQTVAPVQQTVAPAQQTVAPAPVAINPASTRAIKAATTVAQDRPPVLIAKAQPQNAPVLIPPVQPQTPPAVTEQVQPEKPPALPEPVQLEKRPAPTPAANLALEQQKASATPAPPPAAKKYTGEPISVNLKDVDLKDFFRLIHEISGLNIVLDPSVRGTLTLVLDDVPWDQALDVVLHNNGLGRELEGNILRIAAQDTFRKEAEAQRARIDAQALAVNKITVTRFLSYGRAKDVMPTIKKLLTTRGEVLADDRTNGLIISDIPSIIPSIDRLITQLDRKTMQVEIEARVVSATRNFAQQFGTQLGFAWGNGKTSIGGNPSTGLSSQTYTSSTGSFPYFTSAGSIPLFSNLAPTGNTSGLALSTAVGNYRVDVLLSAAESRGLAKVLSRPRVVTQNNVTAVVRQGYRIPIVTQSQLGGPATTTYIDAFLRLTVTPQITVENTIFLAVDVENTTPDFGNSSTTVGGNPSLLTQQATTQVLVSDGGTVVIGGVIQTQSSINIQQVPWLGNIPILGNLFKSRSVSTSTQELIFILSPKIVQT